MLGLSLLHGLMVRDRSLLLRLLLGGRGRASRVRGVSEFTLSLLRLGSSLRLSMRLKRLLALLRLHLLRACGRCVCYTRNRDEVYSASQIFATLGVVLSPRLHIRVCIRIRRVVNVWRGPRYRLSRLSLRRRLRLWLSLRSLWLLSLSLR